MSFLNAKKQSMTPLPRAITFMQAGFDVATYLEVEKRWLTYTEDKRQALVRSVTPNRHTHFPWEKQ
jgi:hypothetical protein